MPPVHGSKATFTIQDSGGVVRDITGFIDQSGLARSADTAEVTVGGNTSKRYIPGLKDATIPIAGPGDNTIDGYLSGILGMERNFVYRPQGAGTGLPEYTGAAIETSYEWDTSVDARGDLTGEFQVTGDVTRTVQA